MDFGRTSKQFNERWNDLPRRGAIVLMVLMVLLVFTALFSYIAPSVLAMILAWAIHPVARWLEGVFRKVKLRGNWPASSPSSSCTALSPSYSFWIGARVVEELRALIAALPGWVSQASDFIQKMDSRGRLPDLRRGDVRLAGV